jgi:hypothetical protein
VGIAQGGQWFDEADDATDGVGAREVIGVTHWMPMPRRPFES